MLSQCLWNYAALQLCSDALKSSLIYLGWFNFYSMYFTSLSTVPLSFSTFESIFSTFESIFNPNETEVSIDAFAYSYSFSNYCSLYAYFSILAFSISADPSPSDCNFQHNYWTSSPLTASYFCSSNMVLTKVLCLASVKPMPNLPINSIWLFLSYSMNFCSISKIFITNSRHPSVLSLIRSAMLSRVIFPQALWRAFPQFLHYLSSHLRALLHLGLVQSLSILFPEGHLMCGTFARRRLSMASSFSSGRCLPYSMN